MHPHPEGHAVHGELDIKHNQDGSVSITHQPHGEDEFSGEGVTHLKLPKLTATVVGAAVGSIAWPVGTLVGASIGAAIDYARHTLGHKVAVSVKTGVTPATAKRAVVLMPIMVKMSGTVTPPASVAKASAAAASAPIPEATALKAYFDRYPNDRILGDSFWKSAHMGMLVQAFQQAFNRDANAVKALGVLKTTGFYDSKTAAGLTFYTHSPIDPDPSVG